MQAPIDVANFWSATKATSHEAIANTVPVSQNTENEAIWSAIRPIFPNTPEEVLRHCAVGCTCVESAVDEVLKSDVSLDTIMQQISLSVD